ncbi:phage major capsid protein [Bifidobacterium mongoliense]
MTTNDLKSFYPDTVFDPGEVVPDALILKVATVTQGIEGDDTAVRIPYVKTDPESGFTKEGADINESDAELDEVVVKTNKIAVLTKQSREAMTPNTSAEHLAAGMQRSVIIKANAALLSNDSDPTGLLNQTGIIDGGTLTDNFDPISDAITSVEAHGGTASCIVMDPYSWGMLCKLKTDNKTLQLGSPAEQTERKLYGLPVYVTPQMTKGMILVIDSTNLVAAVGDIDLITDSSFYFGSDSIAHRLTWRVGWSLVHPDRLAKIKVTLPV